MKHAADGCHGDRAGVCLSVMPGCWSNKRRVGGAVDCYILSPERVQPDCDCIHVMCVQG